jgi:acetyl-CoA carboxylase carboxyl transferase subunit beta
MAFENFKKMIGGGPQFPTDLWVKCPDCQTMNYRKDVEERKMVCPQCQFHLTLSVPERLALMLDEGSFEELWANLAPVDALQFEGLTSYQAKLEEAQQKTGRPDAAVFGTGLLNKKKILFGVTDSQFMMGSMGSVVGEKVTRAFELGRESRLPVVIVSGSGGGARMYEGALSLMQMAKTSAAIARFSEAGGCYVSILTHPTMAGVMASFAALGDVVIAEPRALIGFTGPRVIKETIKKELPPGFQTSEFMLQHGFVDMVVERSKLKERVGRVLSYLT